MYRFVGAAVFLVAYVVDDLVLGAHHDDERIHYLTGLTY